MGNDWLIMKLAYKINVWSCSLDREDVRIAQLSLMTAIIKESALFLHFLFQSLHDAISKMVVPLSHSPLRNLVNIYTLHVNIQNFFEFYCKSLVLELYILRKVVSFAYCILAILRVYVCLSLSVRPLCATSWFIFCNSVIFLKYIHLF